MDDILILQILNNDKAKLIFQSSNEIDIKKKSDLISISRNKKYLSLITSFHAPQQYIIDFIKGILNISEIEGIITSIPSSLSTFALDTENIFYVEIENEDLDGKNIEDIEVEFKIEVIIDTLLDIAASKVLSGRLGRVVYEVQNIIHQHKNKIKLSSNILIEGNDRIKSYVENKFIESISANGNKEQIKNFKFLTVPTYVNESNHISEEIKDHPVLIGAYLASKIRFYETRDFSTKREFFAGEYKELSIH
ncbi:hypothetical protein SLOPH_1167 [Spraguea lophii 42_110]|uniref:Uncharacterized protein n=1 Tax=Spraguea lophii (strain 42_110) TaxID=1358809 RepID=S7WAP7_SPRLO|nr:hypothetical protein SLOPH_1167 [Spraguea lophii 42_110]